MTRKVKGENTLNLTYVFEKVIITYFLRTSPKTKASYKQNIYIHLITTEGRE